MKTVSSKLQIIRIMMIFIIPFVGLLILYNVYNVNTLNRRIALNNQNTIFLYQQAMERDLSDMENYMADFLANDPNCAQLRYSTSNLNAHLLGINVLEKYRSIISTKEMVAGVFLYSEPNSLFRAVYNRNYSYIEKAKTRTMLEAMIHNDPIGARKTWFFEFIGERPFIFRILGNNGIYSICAIDLDYIDVPQNFPENPKNSFLFLVDNHQLPVTEQDRLQSSKIDVRASALPYYVSGDIPKQYFIVQNAVSKIGMTMMYATPYQGVLMNMDSIQITLFIGSLLLVSLLFFSFYFLKRFYLLPLNSLVCAMEQIRDGQPYSAVKIDYQTDEFARLNYSFHEMMTEIQHLKIASYEQQLEIQKVKLQYLRIQIRPHFFLNCLKNLYALAQEQKYRQVQEMILVLSEHLRFMFRDNRTLIPVYTEIENVQNYILLQQMCTPHPPHCIIEIDEALKTLTIPPLSLLTFVENSVKYGAVPERSLEIHVHISSLENGEDSYINLSIRDNGEGFTEENLRLLNQDEEPFDPKHIGIRNVCHRFKLLYGEKSTFFFSNRDGAQIELFFPSNSKIVETEDIL